jgi:hypothetical protein
VFAPHATDGRGECRGSSYSSSLGRHLAELRVKTFPTVVSVSTTPASLWVVHLLGGVGWEASCLVCVFPGENLSPVLRRSDDGGFDVVPFLEALLWKSLCPPSPVGLWLGGRLKTRSLDEEV